MSRIINTEAAEHTESFEWAALRAAGRTFTRRVPLECSVSPLLRVNPLSPQSPLAHVEYRTVTLTGNTLVPSSVTPGEPLTSN